MSATFLRSMVAGALLTIFAGGASAADILCQDAANNHMLVDDSQVSACLDAGTGNIGNGPNDLFLTGVGGDYTEIGDTSDALPGFDLSYTLTGPTATGSTGTWTFDSSAWSAYDSLAIGFKFGTGNQPDEWFVYSVADGISSGDWEFVNVFGVGGGISHMVLYGADLQDPPGQVIPLPGTALLLGFGMLGLGIRRSRAH